MSSIWVIMEAPSVAQAYTLQFSGSWYTRWPLDTVPGQSMRPVPTAPASAINAARDAAERASIPTSMASAVVGAAGGVVAALAGVRPRRWRGGPR
jgi:hypothetical protein